MSTGITNPINNYSGSTAIFHAELEGREQENQHPMSAIEGLEERFNEITSATALIESIGALLTKTTNALEGKYLTATDADKVYATLTKIQEIESKLTDLKAEINDIGYELDIKYPDKVSRIDILNDKVAELSNWYTSSAAIWGMAQNKIDIVEKALEELKALVGEGVTPAQLNEQLTQLKTEITETNKNFAKASELDALSASYGKLDISVQGILTTIETLQTPEIPTVNAEMLDEKIAELKLNETYVTKADYKNTSDLVAGQGERLTAVETTADNNTKTLETHTAELERLDTLAPITTVPTSLQIERQVKEDDGRFNYKLKFINQDEDILYSADLDLTEEITDYLNTHCAASDGRYAAMLTALTNLTKAVSGLNNYHALEITDIGIYKAVDHISANSSSLAETARIDGKVITLAETDGLTFYILFKTTQPIKPSTVELKYGDAIYDKNTLKCTEFGIQNLGEYQYILSFGLNTATNTLVPLDNTTGGLDGFFQNIAPYELELSAIEQIYNALGDPIGQGDEPKSRKVFLEVGHSCYYGYSSQKQIEDLTGFYLLPSSSAACTLTWANAPVDDNYYYYYYVVPASCLAATSTLEFTTDLGRGGFEEIAPINVGSGDAQVSYRVFRSNYELKTCPEIRVIVREN
jgi:hypothetical protein